MATECDHCGNPSTHIASLIPLGPEKEEFANLLTSPELQRAEGKFVRVIDLCTDCTKEFLEWL